MSQITDDANAVIMRYYELFVARYHEHWKPSIDHVAGTIDLLRSPMAGIAGYTKEDLLVRLDAFFKCKEDWIISTKHNYLVFTKHIHRWLPVQTISPPHSRGGEPEGVYKCPECQNELSAPSEICEKCFPHCMDCGFQHAKSESCTEVVERERKLKEMFGSEKPRGSGIKTISEDVA